MGYCAVIFLAALARRRNFFVGLSAGCTILTWLAYAFEAQGAPAWMSVFDRAMVTWVLWLTAILSWRYEQALVALRDQAKESARSNAALERFASVIAHDLRSPLSSIGLTAEVLASSPLGLEGENAEMVGSIRHSVDDIGRMIQDLLSYSRAGHGRLSISPCNCEELLSEVLIRLAAPLQAAGASVTHDALPVVMADKNQLSRVFQNLIENAIKYRGTATPKVHVSSEEGRDEWVFSVRDNGIGIAPEDTQKLFEMFHRGKQDESRYAGTGVGLSVCKTIVGRHGGRIWVRSERGQGTTFWFSVPKAPVALRSADGWAHPEARASAAVASHAG